MNDFKLDTTGMDFLIQRLPQERNAILRAAAAEMSQEAVLSFGTSPNGRIYVRRSVEHIASVAGYPPNVDTGALRASIHFYSSGPDEVTISDGVRHGAYQEFGTTNMDARPWLGPVFARWSGGKFSRFAKEMLRTLFGG